MSYLSYHHGSYWFQLRVPIQFVREQGAFKHRPQQVASASCICRVAVQKYWVST